MLKDFYFEGKWLLMHIGQSKQTQSGMPQGYGVEGYRI